MRKRLRKKIYRRAVQKIESGRELSPVEHRVFVHETMRMNRRIKVFIASSSQMIERGLANAARALRQIANRIKQHEE